MTDLEEIKRKLDIVSFIADYVTLKKAGRNFNGLCPFHSEKTPSFVVSPERQIWHCFGACSEGGDIFTFLMKVENLEFGEALEILAKKTGVTLTRKFQASDNQKLKEEIIKANNLASQFYNFLLLSHKAGKTARIYLEKRKINEKIIKTFSLGYAPQNWDSLARFMRKKGIKDYILTKSGLASSGRSGNLFDRFRGRLMFALKDHRGNVVGFSGRKISEGQTSDNEAKYINTAETAVYVKGNLFYGLDMTKEAIRKKNSAIIVEGEFDFLSSYQAGVTNIVAIKGTALTIHQVNLIKRFTDTIILALDSDLAGDSAQRRGIEIAENAGLNIKVASVTVGKDPDECIKENPGAWKQAVKNCVSVYDYLLESALKRHDINDAYGKKKITDEILPFYGKITNTIVQSHYLTLLSRTINVSEERLTEAIEKMQKGKSVGFASPSVPLKSPKLLLKEDYFLCLLLQASQISYISEAFSQEEQTKILASIESPGIKKVCQLYFAWINQKTDDLSDVPLFIKTLSLELVTLADKAYLYEIDHVLQNKTIYQKELKNLVKDLITGGIRRKLKVLSTKIKENKDEGLLSKLNNEFTLLKNELKKVDKKPLP